MYRTAPRRLVPRRSNWQEQKGLVADYLELQYEDNPVMDGIIGELVMVEAFYSMDVNVEQLAIPFVLKMTGSTEIHLVDPFAIQVAGPSEVHLADPERNQMAGPLKMVIWRIRGRPKWRVHWRSTWRIWAIFKYLVTTWRTNS
ncbi:unnamed protein product [Allacma fusca]|uniref:Uncharacterized protein n=1 Tax=Allacma fusca TaxID=39272 RepID=A0A8J2LV42_9HEXA|nr:unnamed protein product [Allacma fusca]